MQARMIPIRMDLRRWESECIHIKEVVRSNCINNLEGKNVGKGRSLSAMVTQQDNSPVDVSFLNHGGLRIGIL